jgi:hypothetical protein
MVCGDMGDKSRCCAGYSVVGAMFTVSNNVEREKEKGKRAVFLIAFGVFCVFTE